MIFSHVHTSTNRVYLLRISKLLKKYSAAFPLVMVMVYVFLCIDLI